MRASYQRTFWIQALRKLCAERNIFFASFPISDMTVKQLEHATTASFRLCARILHEPPQTVTFPVPLRPFSIRILASFESDNENFENMVLVPGGRFLLTSSGQYMRLWDLGFHSGAIINPSHIAFADVGHSTLSHIAITRSSVNKDEILVLAISVDLDS